MVFDGSQGHGAEEGAILDLFPQHVRLIGGGCGLSGNGLLGSGHLVAIRVGLDVLQRGDSFSEADGQDGVLELRAGLASLAQFGQQVVVGGVLTTEPDVAECLL